MNAVVQCLSNTAPLAERLALGRYRARGARAEVTQRLAALVRALWTRQYTPQLSAEFKNIVSKHSSQFRGNAQHDALEFLLWLLDRMHEDLGAASPAQQSRGPTQVGAPGWGEALGPGAHVCLELCCDIACATWSWWHGHGQGPPRCWRGPFVSLSTRGFAWHPSVFVPFGIATRDKARLPGGLEAPPGFLGNSGGPPGKDGSSGASRSPPGSQHPQGQSFVQSHFQAQYRSVGARILPTGALPFCEHWVGTPQGGLSGGRARSADPAHPFARSSLTCPHCLKQSNTFDPFLCISLPIPLRQTRALNVTLVLQCERWRFVRVGLAVPLLGTVADLREMVARHGRVPAEQVILAEVSPRGLLRSLSDPEALRAAGEAAPVYAFQPPPARRAGTAVPAAAVCWDRWKRVDPSLGLVGRRCPRSLPTSPAAPRPEGPRLLPSAARSSDCLHRAPGGRILLLLCNTAGTGPQLARFGPPLVLREERGVSWEQLQQNILAQLRGVLRGEVRPQGTGALFRIRLAGGSAPCTYLSPQDPRPLCHPAIDRALQLCGAGGPPHVRLTAEWDTGTKERLFGSIQEEAVQDADSVWQQQQAHGQQHSCTLDECFQLYTKEEQLAPDDAWRCPHCKVPQQGTVKLSLWTLPDILIIHLKRFRQVAEQRHKLTTLVRFPLRGLDMAPHVAQRGQPGVQLLGRWAPWQPPLRLPPGCPRDHLYDLYAVCNHHGSMQGGHYTAFCCNALDGRWYSYDDSRVEGVREAEVSTRSAYILFYQRRRAAASGTGHWVFRLAAAEPRTEPEPEPSGYAGAAEN
ncbi:Ubiquitin carboxyl-terminal hydrolase 43, partial [Lonchura striata]